MSDSEIKLFYAQNSEVSKRILAPDEHLRAIDTGAYYVAGPNGKPQAVLTASTSDQGVLKVSTGTATLFTVTPQGAVITTNNIGTPGSQGFGVGVCPVLPPGYAAMPGTADSTSDNYGNYQYSDGSVMVWVPRFYYRIGSPASPLYATYGANAIDIAGDSAFGSEADANSAGYALHRAFFDGGPQLGFFVDKYQCSNNGLAA